MNEIPLLFHAYAGGVSSSTPFDKSVKWGNTLSIGMLLCSKWGEKVIIVKVVQ